MKTQTPAKPASPTARRALQIRYLGRHLDKEGSHPAAALINAPLLPEHRDAVYARLPEGARHRPLLAKKWKLWAVLAIDDWVSDNLHRALAPDA